MRTVRAPAPWRAPLLTLGTPTTDLQYKNLRPEYLKHIWEVVNFKDVAARFREAQA